MCASLRPTRVPFRSPLAVLVAAASLVFLGCAATAPFHPATPADWTQAGSPLGPSYVLVPLPSDDDALLGRVLPGPIDAGRSIDEVSRPNECADKLTPETAGPLASTFEDGQELAAGGKAHAALAAFGFEGDAQIATLFHYELEVSKRVARTDTPEYVACCRDKKTCGYGFVSALVYGDGEYETATESEASGSITVPIAGGAGGEVKAKVLHKRKVHGYLAALVTVTDANAGTGVGVLGDPSAAGITLDEQTLPAQVKERFDAGKVQVVATGSGKVETAYVFRDGSGDITENEFVRRYAAVTGSDALDPARRTRRKGLIAGMAVLTVAGAAALVVGATNIHRTCTHGDVECESGATSVPFILLTAAGGLMTAGGGIGLGFSIAKSDGSTRDHVISRFDAELYASRYDRSLLRRTVEEARARMREVSREERPALEIAPVLSPGFTGLVGRF